MGVSEKRDSGASGPDASAPVRGVVHRAVDLGVYDVGRAAPGPVLAPFVEHLWWVRWDLVGREPRTVRTIPFPAVNLTVEDGRTGEVRHGHPLPAALVHGVPSGAFSVELDGAGWAVGVRFAPGGWAAWSRRDAAALTGRVVLAGDLDPAWGAAGRAVMAAADVPERLEVLREHLSRRPVEPDARYLAVRAGVEAAAADPSQRVEDLAGSLGCSARTLQRRFARLVGVGPKWVLARYRLQEAVLELERDGADLAEVAHRFGWYDQSHLAADLRRVLGTTPGRYARAARSA